MIAISRAYHEAREKRGATELIAFELTNAYGTYVFSDLAPSDAMLGLAGAPMADGSYLADGSATAGSGYVALLGYGPYVKSFGTIRQTMTAGATGDILAGFVASEPASFTITLHNRGNLFSRIEARENLLGAVGRVRLGYPGLAAVDYLDRFAGVVTQYQLTRALAVLQLVAVDASSN